MWGKESFELENQGSPHPLGPMGAEHVTGDIGSSRVERGAGTQCARSCVPMGTLCPLVIITTFSLSFLGLGRRCR